MTDPPKSPTDAELLVAYLDDELEPMERSRVERRLATEERLRAHLRELQRAWDVLDELPRSAFNPDFTASTLSVVAARVAEETQPSRPSVVVRHWSWIRHALYTALAAVVAFAAFATARSYREHRQLREVPVLQSLDLYQQAVSFEFLQRLAARGPFAVGWNSGSGAEDRPSTVGVSTTPKGTDTARDREKALALARTADEVRAALEAISGEEAEELRLRRNRFRRLSPEEQGRIRSFHTQFLASPQRESLYEVLRNYHAWVGDLEAETRAKLRELPMPQRLARVVELVRDQRQAQQSPPWLDFTPLDFQALRGWLVGYVMAHQQELKRLVPERYQWWMDKNDLESAPEFRKLAILRLIPRGSFPAPSPDDIQNLLQSLSPNARRRVEERLEKAGPEFWSRFLSTAPRPGEGRMPIDPQRLRQYLEGLPPQERRRLLMLSPDETQSEMRGRFRGGEERPPFGPPMGHEFRRRGPFPPPAGEPWGPPGERPRPDRGPDRDRRHDRGPPPPEDDPHAPRPE